MSKTSWYPTGAMLFLLVMNVFRIDPSINKQQQLQETIVELSHSLPFGKQSFVFKKGDFAIFFNIYADPKQPSFKFSNIVKEQMQQIHDSSFRNATIYFVTIGKNLTDVCPKNTGDGFGKCVFLKHYEEGWEERTLTMLHRYCRRYPNDTVAYIHNKGSLNNNGPNIRNRRIATKAVLSEACKNISHHDQFNVCGMRFSTQPHVHFNTNFFTAQCDYVRHLVPPRHYDGLRQRMCKDFRTVYPGERPAPCGFNASAFDQDGNLPLHPSYGTGRHAMERWIASHPLFSPGESFHEKLRHLPLDGLPEFEAKLTRPRCIHEMLLSNDIPALSNHIRQYQYMFGEYIPREGGTCRVLLARSKPKVCEGESGHPIHNFSIYDTVVKPMLDDEPTDPF